MATAKKSTRKNTRTRVSKRAAASTKRPKALKRSKNTKKPAAKQTAIKQTGKVLVCADDQECFWTTDGQILKDLTELRDALKDMQNVVFAHHVSRAKNDFADWVEQVLRDSDCAAQLRKVQKPHTARLVVVRCLRSYRI